MNVNSQTTYNLITQKLKIDSKFGKMCKIGLEKKDRFGFQIS